jgi:hypothetical protein
MKCEGNRSGAVFDIFFSNLKRDEPQRHENRKTPNEMKRLSVSFGVVLLAFLYHCGIARLCNSLSNSKKEGQAVSFDMACKIG